MKKIGFLVLLVLVLTACAPGNHAVRFARLPSTPGLSHLDGLQIMILVLLALCLLVPVVLVLFLLIRCLVFWRRIVTQPGHWKLNIRDPDALWDAADEPIRSRQVNHDQEWLFSQLVSQSQDPVEQFSQDGTHNDW